MNGLRRYSEEGAWTAPHHYWYQHASDLLGQYNHIWAKYAEVIGPDPDPQVPAWCVDETANTLRQRLFATHSMVLIACCLTIEGFLNYYGVRRLGEVFYKQNIERLGITEKLSLIVVTLFQTELDADDSLWTSVRRLFDERNSLVHPKSKELTPERLNSIRIPDEPSFNAPYREIELMEEIIASFCSFDPEIRKDLEFPGMEPSP